MKVAVILSITKSSIDVGALKEECGKHHKLSALSTSLDQEQPGPPPSSNTDEAETSAETDARDPQAHPLENTCGWVCLASEQIVTCGTRLLLF